MFGSVRMGHGKAPELALRGFPCAGSGKGLANQATLARCSLARFACFENASGTERKLIQM